VDAARVEKLTHEMWDAYGFRKSSPRLPQLLAGRHLAKLPRDLSQELPHKAWEMQIFHGGGTVSIAVSPYAVPLLM